MLKFFSEELLLTSPYRSGDLIYENTKAGNYSFTIQFGGVYQIELVGAGGGADSNASDGNHGIPSAGGAGACGGYYKGLFRIPGGSTISGSIGAGGANNNTNVYAYTSASPGGNSTMSISETLTLTCNGGAGGYGGGDVSGGTATLNNSSKLVQEISKLQGRSGLHVTGGAYYHGPVESQNSYYNDNNTSSGAGGKCAYGATTAGYAGAIRVKFIRN